MALCGTDSVGIYCFKLDDNEWYQDESFGVVPKGQDPRISRREYFCIGGTSMEVFTARQVFVALKSYVWWAASWKNYSDLANWLNEVNE